MTSPHSPISISSSPPSPPSSPESAPCVGRSARAMRSQHVDMLITAMKSIDDCTIDSDGRAARELQDPTAYTNSDFVLAATRLLINLEEKFLQSNSEGIFDASVPQMVKRDFDIRFKHLLLYLKSCKNSCKVFLKPTTFMDDVLNNPQEMLRRFTTNHKGYGNTKRKIQALTEAATPLPNKETSGASGRKSTSRLKKRMRVDIADEICTPSEVAREPAVTVGEDEEGEEGKARYQA